MKRWVLLGVVAVALAIGGAVTAWLLLTQTRTETGSSDSPAAHGAGPAVPAGTVFFTIDPSFVVNFELPSPVRFLQVTVELELRSAADQEAVRAQLPVIRNNLLLLFGSQDYERLRTREGKERLRGEVLREVQGILKERAGRDGVTQVYFTHFVMQ
ncbi:MAG TPA: flagellar basal body-associated FliL family protein [Candidatus Acidoferrales bacterium]|nr:flagellar basal body-associated FliL family protein [Candidatus Acidoferrales bacterium]